jgi:hypothetical protein
MARLGFGTRLNSLKSRRRHECDRGGSASSPIGKFLGPSKNHTSEEYDWINWLRRSERLAADECDLSKVAGEGMFEAEVNGLRIDRCRKVQSYRRTNGV